jgi:DNA-binding SARP family transcriptional activator
MSRLFLRVFGGVEACLASQDPVRLPSKKAQALLAYLALTAGATHRRDKLATLLWGEAPADKARHSLRQALVALRRVLQPMSRAALIEDGDGVAVDPGAVEVDARLFQQAVAEASPAGWDRAITLYRGDLLEGLDIGEPGFEEWLLTERERFRELAMEVHARLLRHQTDAGAVAAAIGTALGLLQLDPTEEAAHRSLIEAGEAGQAIAPLERAVRLVAQFRFRSLHAQYTAFLARALLRQGDAEKARALAGQALADASEYRYAEAMAHVALGTIARASEDLDAAYDHLSEAATRFAAMGAHRDLGWTRLSLAEVTARRGARAEAAECLGDAYATFSRLAIVAGRERVVSLARDLALALPLT